MMLKDDKLISLRNIEESHDTAWFIVIKSSHSIDLPLKVLIDNSKRILNVNDTLYVIFKQAKILHLIVTKESRRRVEELSLRDDCFLDAANCVTIKLERQLFLGYFNDLLDSDFALSAHIFRSQYTRSDDQMMNDNNCYRDTSFK